MRIGFLGDLHGHVLEALSAVLRYQRDRGPLDLVVQVGDFATPYESLDPDDHPPDSYERLDPGQMDFERLRRADGDLADALRWARTQLAGPVLFIRGNHEDEDWLDAVGQGPVDPFDLFHYVPDATVLERDGVRLAFCGGASDEGIEDPSARWSVGRHGVRAAPTERLLGDARPVDVLVTHDTHYGYGRGYHGDVQGSRRVAALRDRLRPRWHVSGHLHHVVGPVRIGPTRWVQLGKLGAGGRWEPAGPGVAVGSLGVLDTSRESFEFVDEPWMRGIGGYGRRYDFAEAWTAGR